MSDSTKHWADREERGSFWLMKLTAFAAKVLGRRLLSPVLYGIVLYFFLFGRTAPKCLAIPAAPGRLERARCVAAQP